MVKHLLGVGVVLVAGAFAAPVLAEINPEPFLPEAGYSADTALSSFYWDANLDENDETIDTTGVLDIVDTLTSEHGLAAKLTADGLTQSFPSIAATAVDWGGPNRSGDGQFWFAADIEKGSGNTLSSNIYQLSFNRPNGANLITIDGGFGTFRLKTQGGSLITPTFNLGQGWNQVAVFNDIDAAAPNTILYLNGIQIATLHVTATGPLTNPAGIGTGIVSLNRQGRGGVDDPIAGTVRFDNIISADEDILKFLSGDVSHDGIVDVSDIQVIAVNYLGPGPAGDANNDGLVDVSDIQVIAAHYLDGAGHSPYPGNGAGTGSAVPEPSTVVLMIFGLALGVGHVYRRRVGM